MFSALTSVSRMFSATEASRANFLVSSVFRSPDRGSVPAALEIFSRWVDAAFTFSAPAVTVPDRSPISAWVRVSP